MSPSWSRPRTARPDGAGPRLDRERTGIAEPGREAAPVGEALALPRRVEQPDARVALQLPAGIDSLRAGHPIHPLAAVGGGGDVHEHRGRPSRTRGSSPCGRRRRGGRPRRSPARPRARAGPARASSGGSGRSARGRDSRRAARTSLAPPGPKRLPLLGLAVAVAVAQREDAAPAAGERGVERAVGPDGELPNVARVARHDDGAEALAEHQAAVVAAQAALRSAAGAGRAARRSTGARSAAARNPRAADGMTKTRCEGRMGRPAGRRVQSKNSPFPREKRRFPGENRRFSGENGHFPSENGHFPIATEPPSVYCLSREFRSFSGTHGPHPHWETRDGHQEEDAARSPPRSPLGSPPAGPPPASPPRSPARSARRARRS